MKVAVRLKKKDEKALEEVKEIFQLKNLYGSNSDAVKKALHFTKENAGRPIRRFKMDFGETEKELILNKFCQTKDKKHLL